MGLTLAQDLRGALNEHLEQQYERQVRALRQRAEAALEELGELDTPEKQERAQQIRITLQEAIGQLKQKLSEDRRD